MSQNRLPFCNVIRAVYANRKVRWAILAFFIFLPTEYALGWWAFHRGHMVIGRVEFSMPLRWRIFHMVRRIVREHPLMGGPSSP